MRNQGALRPRWTPIFDRISEDKRQRVLFSAKKAFAQSGFMGANVNEIAKDAGISVGALYKYFRSKEDIFLAIIEASRERLESTLNAILEGEATFYGRVAAILRAAVDSSSADPDMVRIYIACTTQELEPLAGGLALRIESAAAEKYSAMVARAREQGEIHPPCDDRTAAFCLDDLFLSLQFSYGSSYYHERLKIFLGGTIPEDPEDLVQALLAFIGMALGGAPSAIGPA
jgi:TetR/AcrR family transcriptional regulator